MKFIDESATSPRPLGESRCKYVPIPFSSLKRPLTETIGRALQSSKNTNLFRLSVATQCLVCGRLFVILPAEIDISPVSCVVGGICLPSPKLTRRYIVGVFVLLLKLDPYDAVLSSTRDTI